MADKKDKKKAKKKLELSKETIQELTDEQLNEAAGGADLTPIITATVVTTVSCFLCPSPSQRRASEIAEGGHCIPGC